MNLIKGWVDIEKENLKYDLFHHMTMKSIDINILIWIRKNKIYLEINKMSFKGIT